MNSILLLAALTVAQPMPKQVSLVVAPAGPPRNLLRVRLLPPLLEQQPGECLALIAAARQALKDAVPAGEYRQLEEELGEDRDARLQDVDRKRLKTNLERVKRPLELLEKAARAQRCDWSQLNRDLRTKGIRARLDFVQEFRAVVPLLAVRARLEVLEDRPEDAVKTLALGLRICQRLGESPTLISHLVGVAITAILLEQLDVVLAHPKCPNLYWALTDIPRPFLSLHSAMEGERCSVYGTFPSVVKFALDPNGPLPTEAEMKEFVRVLDTSVRDIGIKFTELDRLGLGVAIQFKHEAALKALADQGYPAAKIRKWPPLLVAIVHALLEYEENLGRMQLAMELPYWEAIPKIEALEKELRPRGLITTPTSPAIPLSRLLLPAVQAVLRANVRTERRLAALTTVEALRLHAARTGAWPKTLAEIAVSVPLDPVTGKPFEYRVEAGVAILHGPLLTGKETGNFELFYRLRLK